MSGSRRDPRKAKLRRERIRREKCVQRASAPPSREPTPVVEHPFASERALVQIHALLEGQKFGSVDEADARLAELTREGRLAERANAWKQDDPRWRAQQLAYDALETEDLEEALRLIHEALKLDPERTDAQRLMVSVLPMSLENRIGLMRDKVETAERNLGERFFRENRGRFWGLITTRPYMRAKRHLGGLLADAGDFEGGIAVYERRLELNSDDSQGIRCPLLALYLAANRPEGAAGLMSRYPDEEKFSGSFAWARVLERWLTGKLPEAEAAWARAREVNPFVERYASAARALPREGPEYYRPGEDSEAGVARAGSGRAAQSLPQHRNCAQARWQTSSSG